jgi:uncharacterized protein YraI
MSMKPIKWIIAVAGLTMSLWLFPALVKGQQSGVTAEAVGQANLRAWTDVNATLLGQITKGTQYPVLGRSELYPWLLLGDPTTRQPIGWVYLDLVTTTGDMSQVPLSSLEVGSVTLAPSLTPTLLIGDASTQNVSPGPTAAPVSAATATLSGVTGLVTGEINIRFGPGVDYPRIGVGHAGDVYQITARHTGVPWVQIRYSGAPNGFGWVAKELLDIQGDLNSVPPISQTNFALPTLTPTAEIIQASSFNAATPVPLSQNFKQLGDNLWNMMLKAGFDPETSKLGGLFLMDLQTNEAITFGNKVAFSGMSLNKIAILATLYSRLEGPPSPEIALDIANMMVCSENSASNDLLRYLGNGDVYEGAKVVTQFMERIGLGNTYIVAPFKLEDNATPAPVVAPTTSADQAKAQPDYSNQMTVDNLGWLLDGVYQCAYNNGGPLMSAVPGAFDSRECHQMLDVMSDNNLAEPLLMSAGVPQNTRVAHKHGWTNDTHGNAGIVFTPGGNYVLVVALHNPSWLDFSESFPLITEISRNIYNYYNPSAQVKEDRQPYIVPVDDCKVGGTPILDELTSLNYQP